MNRFAIAFLLLASASTSLSTGCGTPGVQVDPEPGDFAFLHVKLKG